MKVFDPNQSGSLSREQILTVVIDLVVKSVDEERAHIGPDTPLFSSLGRFDSFALLELVLRLESTFGLSIPDEDLDRDIFKSPQAIVGYVYGRLHAASPGEFSQPCMGF